MPITYGDGGTNRTPTAIYYQDGATLRAITEVWYCDGGVNRQVFGLASVNLANHTIHANHSGVGAASATFTLSSSGQASGSSTSSGTGGGVYAGEWLTSGSAGSCEVRATLSAGSAPTSGTIGAWESLGTSRSWSSSRAVAGSHSSTILIEIRNGGVVLDSASIAISATKT